MTGRIIMAALMAVSWGSGCSSGWLYHSGQAWQRNYCNTIPVEDDRQRCMQSTSQSWEEYQKEVESNRNPGIK